MATIMRDAQLRSAVETNFERRGALSSSYSSSFPLRPVAFLLSGRLAPDLPGRGLNREREEGERCKQGMKGGRGSGERF